MDEHDKRARDVVESVRGMSSEAQALVLGNALRAASRHGYERGELAALAATNEEQVEAVAAERERCKTIADDAFMMAMGHASSGDPCQWLDTVREEIANGTPVATLRSAPLASPAQAERVSEDDPTGPT